VQQGPNDKSWSSFKHGKHILVIDAAAGSYISSFSSSDSKSANAVRDAIRQWRKNESLGVDDEGGVDLQRDKLSQGLFADGIEEDDHEALCGMFSSLFELVTCSSGVADVGLRLRIVGFR
jgi:hypothetical protein